LRRVAQSLPIAKSIGEAEALLSTNASQPLAKGNRDCGCQWVKTKKTLTSPQIRAARALIRWTAEDLSRQSAVSLRTIRRAELAERNTSMTAANDLAIRRALEAAGVEFIDEDGGGPGVRLRKRQGKKA
jgi:hypothetical protein